MPSYYKWTVIFGLLYFQLYILSYILKNINLLSENKLKKDLTRIIIMPKVFQVKRTKNKENKMKTINVYEFNELNDAAKEHALSKYQSSNDYPWNDENSDVLNAFEKIFPIKVTDYEYGYRNDISFEFTGHGEIEGMAGIRLMKYIYNNFYNEFTQGKYYSTQGYYDENKKYHYKFKHSKIQRNNHLTGYYIEEDILKPIIDFLKEPNDNIDFNDLMNSCLYAWVHACDNDYQNTLTMEYYEEHAMANEYEFNEDGNMC